MFSVIAQVIVVFSGCEEALHDQSALLVGQVSPSEWLTVLKYFIGAGHDHPQLCDAAATWAKEHVGELQLHQLEALVSALAHLGHLPVALGEQVVGLLTPLPPSGTEMRALMEIAGCLASTDIGAQRFYQSALRCILRGRTSFGGEVAQVTVLKLLAKARPGSQEAKATAGRSKPIARRSHGTMCVCWTLSAPCHPASQTLCCGQAGALEPSLVLSLVRGPFATMGRP